MVSPTPRTLRRRLALWQIGIALAVLVVIILRLVMQDVAVEQRPKGASPLVGSLAPDFTVPALDGTEISLSLYRGQPLLINFWASWCYPCREEMPELVRVYELHKDDGLMVLGVNLTSSDDLPGVRAFVEEFKISFPVLLDTEAVIAGQLFQIPGLPTSIFVNRDGTVERVHVGVLTPRQIDVYVAEILD